jgi:hypothetical protein
MAFTASLRPLTTLPQFAYNTLYPNLYPLQPPDSPAPEHISQPAFVSPRDLIRTHCFMLGEIISTSSSYHLRIFASISTPSFFQETDGRSRIGPELHYIYTYHTITERPKLYTPQDTPCSRGPFKTTGFISSIFRFQFCVCGSICSLFSVFHRYFMHRFPNAVAAVNPAFAPVIVCVLGIVIACLVRDGCQARPGLGPRSAEQVLVRTGTDAVHMSRFPCLFLDPFLVIIGYLCCLSLQYSTLAAHARGSGVVGTGRDGKNAEASPACLLGRTDGMGLDG